MIPRTWKWLPVEPLLPHIPEPQHQWGEANRVGGVRAVLDPPAQRAIYRAKASGRITLRMADEIACKLGKHPFEIWGWDWYEL